MLSRSLACAEQAGALENNLNTKVAPRQLGGITLSKNLDAVAVNDDVITVDFDRARKTTMRRVAPRQMSIRIRVAQVVDGTNVELISRSEEHTSELQSLTNLVFRIML